MELIPQADYRGRSFFPGCLEVVGVPLLPAAFMDVLAVPTEAGSCTELLAHVDVVCSTLVELGRLFGLLVNFSSGKSQAIVLLTGSAVDKA